MGAITRARIRTRMTKIKSVPSIFKWSWRTIHIAQKQVADILSVCRNTNTKHFLPQMEINPTLGIKASNGFWITRSRFQFWGQTKQTCKHMWHHVQKISKTAQRIITTFHLIWLCACPLPPHNPVVQPLNISVRTVMTNSFEKWLTQVEPGGRADLSIYNLECKEFIYFAVMMVAFGNKYRYILPAAFHDRILN